MEIREQKKIVSPDLVMEPLLGLLDETPAVPLVISGGSMVPFLIPGRDTVYLSRITAPVSRGDMVLYRRADGSYVLHRVLRAEGDSFMMLGDAQTAPEAGIGRKQLLAIVTAVRRKGKLLRRGSFWWEFFRILWIRMVPLRPLAGKIYGMIKNVFRGSV